MKRVKEKWIGIRRIGLFNADVAALSAFSLPEISTWLDNEQNIIFEEWVNRLWDFNNTVYEMYHYTVNTTAEEIHIGYKSHTETTEWIY